MLFAGSIGWGLLTIGAITHVWHHGRLRMLLAQHVDHERPLAAALTAVEVAIAVMLPVGVLTSETITRVTATAAAAVGLVFVGWIGRLLATGSSLPCACSFSEAPTTTWSLARAGAVVLVAALLFVDLDSIDRPEALAAMAVGLAASAAIFVLPDALAWPDASRALLARLDAHRPVEGVRR